MAVGMWLGNLGTMPTTTHSYTAAAVWSKMLDSLLTPPQRQFLGAEEDVEHQRRVLVLVEFFSHHFLFSCLDKVYFPESI